MNIARRLICFFLSACLLIAACSTVFGAANFDDDGNRDQENGLSEEDYDVVVDNSHPYHELDNPEDAYTGELEYDEYIELKNQYNVVVEKLTSVGAWEENTEKDFTELIPAGEYFISVCRYIEYNAFYSESATVEENAAAAYNALKDLGFIDIEISATDNITYEQALRILMNALGYKDLAQYNGGDIQAYVQLADSHDIISGVPDNMAEELTYSDAANLIEGSLDGEACYIETTTNGYGYRYIRPLEHYKDIYEMSGIVKSVSDLSISSDNTYTDSIVVGDELIQAANRDLNDYLACNVDLYYKLTDSNDKVLCYISYNKKNNIKTIEGYDLDEFSDDRIYYYETSAARKKAVLNNDYVTVMSGFKREGLTWEDLENCDYVRLVDNDGDNRYDAVFVYKYDIMFVKRVDVENGVIYGILNNDENGKIEVDFDDNRVKMKDRVGNPVESYYITEDSVLSIASDTESTRKNIIVSNLYYSGTVTATETGEEYYDNKVVFGDKKYTYSTNYDYYRGAKSLKIGESYTVYLDYRSRIAGYDTGKSEELQYGFLIKAWNNNEGGEYAYAKIYPYVGDMAEFKFAEKVKVDGENCKGAEWALGCLQTAAGYQTGTLDVIDESYQKPEYENKNLIYLRAPVMYKTNDAGEITYIDTPYHGPNENKEKADTFGDNSMTMYNDFSKRTSSLKPGGMYLRNTLAFNNDNGTVVAMDTNTKVFVVPVSNNIDDINNDNLYSKSNLAYFKDWVYYPQTGTNYLIENRLEAYNVNESRTAGVMVYYTSDAVPEIDKKVPLSVVSKVIEAVDEDGDEVEQLVAWQGNAEIRVNIADGVSLTRFYNGENGEKIESTVRKGDIIRYVTNAQGELVDYVKVFSLTDEDDPDYVKTGNEYGKAVDPSTLNKTLLAVSDGKYAKNGHDTSHVYTSIGAYNYGAQYRLVYGTLLYRNGNNLVIRTKVDNAMGQSETTEIADFSGFNVLCIDEAADRIYVPRADELLSETEAGEDASKVILHTEGGKQRQLIIVKRAK